MDIISDAFSQAALDYGLGSCDCLHCLLVFACGKYVIKLGI